MSRKEIEEIKQTVASMIEMGSPLGSPVLSISALENLENMIRRILRLVKINQSFDLKESSRQLTRLQKQIRRMNKDVEFAAVRKIQLAFFSIVEGNEHLRRMHKQVTDAEIYSILSARLQSLQQSIGKRVITQEEAREIQMLQDHLTELQRETTEAGRGEQTRKRGRS